MVCEVCSKNRATIHLTELTQNVKKELHLCEECAQQKQIVQKVTFSLSDLLGKLVDPQMGKVAPGATELKCPQCGITFGEFRAKARFGCANDYEVFKPALIPLLEKIHGSTQHCGKVPGTADVSLKKENELIRLKRELGQMVKSEDFEKAAELRDRIKLLEDELKKSSKT